MHMEEVVITQFFSECIKAEAAVITLYILSASTSFLQNMYSFEIPY